MFSVGKWVSIRPMPLPLPSPQRFISKCATNEPTSMVAPNNNFAFEGVSKSRTDLQSSCAIFASTLAEGQPKTKETKKVDNINTSDHSKPLTFNETYPSPTHGSVIRVAYQGIPGAYSEAAACKSFPNCEAVPCEQFEVAFQAVELWTVDCAVLPIENSLGGSIHRNYDLLLRHRLHIVGEVQLPVRHCLLALPGVAKENLNRVISHPQALAQCEATVTGLGLNLTRESFYNTAGAAEFVAKNNLRDTAAIASERAAKLYGLNILVDGIHDVTNNLTRFMILARQPNIPCMGRPFRTSIVFAHDNGTTELFKVLSAFAFRNIKLTKIESRPRGAGPATVIDNKDVGTVKHFEYLFYVDFEASMADVRAQNALADVQEFTSFLRVLGSYPIDTTLLSRTQG